jgi:hypothetical protein
MIARHVTNWIKLCLVQRTAKDLAPRSPATAGFFEIVSVNFYKHNWASEIYQRALEGCQRYGRKATATRVGCMGQLGPIRERQISLNWGGRTYEFWGLVGTFFVNRTHTQPTKREGWWPRRIECSQFGCSINDSLYYYLGLPIVTED